MMQTSAVGSQAGLEPARDEWCQFPSHEGRTDQDDFRLMFLSQGNDNIPVEGRLIEFKNGGFGHQDPVGTDGNEFSRGIAQVVSEQDGLTGHPQFIRQLPGLPEQLQGDQFYLAVTLLGDDPDGPEVMLHHDTFSPFTR